MSWVPYAEAFESFVAEKATEAFTEKSKEFAKNMAGKAKRATKRTPSTKHTYATQSKKAKFHKTQRDFVGHDVGTGLTKRTRVSVAAVNNQVYNIDTRVLYGSDATAINQGLAINERLRGLVDFRGIQVNFALKNNRADPLVFNYAVIGMRNKLVAPTTTGSPYTLPTVATDGFFRDYTSSRDVNFATTAWTAYNLNGLQMCNLPISTDQYAVFCHKKVWLKGLQNPADQDYSADGQALKIVKDYCKVDRQIRYNDDSSTNPETPIYIVYWAETPMSGSADTPGTAAIAVSQMHVAFWREPM